MLASVAEMKTIESKSTMITNTAAYTIVAIAYIAFIVGTWLMFTL